MTTPGFRSLPLPGLRYRGRRHRSVDDGRPFAPRVLRLHWSAGARELDALAAFFRARTKEASYNWAIDRAGTPGELIGPEDAAWDAGDGRMPDVDQLLEHGFVAAASIPRERTETERKIAARRNNLIGVSMCFCNRGFIKEVDLPKMSRAEVPIVKAPHRNPAMKSQLWEDYTPEAIDAFIGVLPAIIEACPSLKVVMGHEDCTNGYVNGRGEWSGGSKTDPGPAFPWHIVPWRRFGLHVVRFDYTKSNPGWRVFPDAGCE